MTELDDGAEEIKCEFTLTHEALREQMQCVALAWNSTGSVLAVAYARTDYEDWWRHSAAICTVRPGAADMRFFARVERKQGAGCHRPRAHRRRARHRRGLTVERRQERQQPQSRPDAGAAGRAGACATALCRRGPARLSPLDPP